jgi:hypothetical protein
MQKKDTNMKDGGSYIKRNCMICFLHQKYYYGHQANKDEMSRALISNYVLKTRVFTNTISDLRFSLPMSIILVHIIGLLFFSFVYQLQPSRFCDCLQRFGEYYNYHI